MEIDPADIDEWEPAPRLDDWPWPESPRELADIDARIRKLDELTDLQAEVDAGLVPVRTLALALREFRVNHRQRHDVDALFRDWFGLTWQELRPKYPLRVPRTCRIAPRSHCVNGHEWNTINRNYRPNGYSECRPCRHERHKRNYQPKVKS